MNFKTYLGIMSRIADENIKLIFKSKNKQFESNSKPDSMLGMKLRITTK